LDSPDRPRIVPPAIGDKVEIVGEKGVYLVVRVDGRRYLADLMLVCKTAKVEAGVAFAAIKPVPNRVPLALSTKIREIA
jgi:hypothetical protein